MTQRNARLRRRRTQGASTRQLSREFKISQIRVRQILEETGGDPRAAADLARAGTAELQRERDRLRDRIAADRRRLRNVLEELDSRETDRILGLSG